MIHLSNIEVIQSRVENYQPAQNCNTVIARAFAPLEKALELLVSVCEHRGLIQIMLGTYPKQLPSNKDVCHIDVLPIAVPGLDSNRHLLIAQRE